MGLGGLAGARKAVELNMTASSGMGHCGDLEAGFFYSLVVLTANETVVPGAGGA